MQKLVVLHDPCAKLAKKTAETIAVLLVFNVPDITRTGSTDEFGQVFVDSACRCTCRKPWAGTYLGQDLAKTKTKILQTSLNMFEDYHADTQAGYV